ncbi:MAG: pfkB-3 [Candidatus Saccharibacteria bacterium]|nr:pfkB-3 [Candidatus Saccharibacteria bacterium]
MSNSELLAIGGAYVDINCPDFPFDNTGLQPETEIVGGDYLFEAGGSAPNFVRLCSALEIPTTFIGKVGEDKMGQVFSDLLEAAGVTPALIVESEVKTNISMNLVNSDGKSIMAVAGNANQSLSAPEVQAKVEELLNTSSYLFIGGCFKLKSLLPAFTELVAAAKDKGVKTVLDHGRLNSGVTADEIETVKRLAQSVDYYLPSTVELQELWQVSSIEEGLQLLARTATGMTVVKDGNNGAVAIVDNAVVKVPAFNVQPIHTVGAGDSFDAGFIAAQSEGKSVFDSIKFACATAALKISQDTLPTRRAVEHYIANN